VPLELEVSLELRHLEGSDGVQHFTLQSALGARAPVGASSTSTWKLNVRLPVLSVSWVHRHREVLAARIKGVKLHASRERSSGERNDDCDVEVSAQHLQVDHFVQGELPVVLNKRFFHVNSRMLGRQACALRVKWVLGSRVIQKLHLDVVPYWLNLELGVLIRLLDLAEGSFGSLGQQDEHKRAPLAAPLRPCSGEEGSQAMIWRLMELVVEPLRLTILLRSPDPAAVRDNPTARWITRLPTDMPNMDLILSRTEMRNRLGSTQQLLGSLKRKYRRRVKYSALWSIILSYVATILKGLLNALWWLARGPYDAINVAHASRQGSLWWVSPVVHGVAEGTYRAMAELIGNSVFGVVVVLNAIRHPILNATRPRAQSLLDGVIYGFRGLVLDSVFTPMQQLLLQTQVAYQDWGQLRAVVVLCLSLLRLPLGPVLGGLHFVASSCEGLANILLHEEAQFAPFEPQRVIEGVSLGPTMDSRDTFANLQVAGAATSRSQTPTEETPHAELPRNWWQFQWPLQRVTRLVADDDEVLETVGRPLTLAFQP